MQDDAQYLIQLSGFVLDINDVNEIFDETEDTITIAGYFNHEPQTLILAGADAQALKQWLDADHERYVAYLLSKGEPVRDVKRPWYNTASYLSLSTIEDEQDIPF